MSKDILWKSLDFSKPIVSVSPFAQIRQNVDGRVLTTQMESEVHVYMALASDTRRHPMAPTAATHSLPRLQSVPGGNKIGVQLTHMDSDMH